MSDSRPQTNKTTKTSFRVIEALSEESGSRVTDLARRLEMPKSTVYKHLSTLQDIGYVVKSDEQYRLSASFVELGDRTRRDHPFYRETRADVSKLAEITGDVVGLFVAEDGRGIDLYQLRGTSARKNEVCFRNTPHLHASAAGKALLARLPEDRVAELVDDELAAVADNTITDRAELFDQLETVRERGIAFEFEEQRAGYHSIAMGVTDSGGDVLGAIYVAGPAERMATQRMQQDLTRALESTRGDAER
jgi:DNA-binding IclR family transcriptional regulator